MNDKIKTIVKSESFKSIFAAVLCAIIGILVGYIILLIINAPHATKAIGTILKNFMYFRKPHQRLYYFGSTLVKAVPLILCGLSVLFAYKAGLFNIGVGGQYCVAIGISLWCALSWHMPWWLCVLIATAAAAFWGAIVGCLKAFFNINEVIACIMMNWIGLYLINILMHNETVMNLTISETYLIRNVSPKSIIPSLGLEKLFHNNEYVSIAIPLTIIIAVLIHVVLKRCVIGYELTATGLNKHAAKYSGMKERLNIIITMAIAGALAGIAASFFYLTDIQQWKTASSVPSMGFNGIAVAFLGGLNPIGVVFAGYFIQHITLGGSFIDMRYFNPQIADLISSIIIYACAFVLFIKEMFVRIIEKKRASLSERASGAANDSGTKAASGASPAGYDESSKGGR
ncbi:ABC transporter permease [Treponema sp.]|uniref:ABC transporter permease n=1 Tax=Treponema sp. TaxID=166 RepID=UPI00298DB257|nr:ABC transporter permease [Treponema sp.]MCR5612485.1 ABC transporter permease [Treponema sp.]